MVVVAKNQREFGAAEGLTVTVDVFDAAAGVEAVFLIQHNIYYILKAPFGASRLVGKLFAALEAAALQNEAAGVGGVALHEAMFLLPLALVGLVSAFRHKIKSYSLLF